MKRAVVAVLVALLLLAASACGGTARTASHGTTLRLSFALGALSADGTRIVALPAGHNGQLGAEQPLHAVIWNSSTDAVSSLKLPHLCADPSTAALEGPAAAVVLCDDSCCATSDVLIAALKPGADPVPIMHATSALGHAGERIDGLAGSGDLVVFNVDRVTGLNRIENAVLYRVHGTHARAIARGPDVGQPVAVARGLILTQRQKRETPKQIAIFGSPPVDLRVFKVDGSLVSHSTSEYSVPEYVPLPTLLFDGRETYGVDFYGNMLSGSRSDGSYDQHFCVVGPGVTLTGISGAYVTYTTADAVHVIRRTDCRDAILAVGGGVPAGAVITPKGVFYAFNKRPTLGMPSAAIGHDRSTLTFVPMAKVKADVGRGLDLSEYQPHP